ncbi:MAG: OmpA family protein [Nitrospirales bacterium]|nr:OmpA family protein [Nitrospirales bacterium]
MKIFPTNIRVNKKTSDQPTPPSQANQQSGEPSDSKEILLLSSGLLALVLGIGGLLMYTEESPQPATASQPIRQVEMAKAFSSPVNQPATEEFPVTEASAVLSESEANPATADPLSAAPTVSPADSTIVNFGFSQATLTEEGKNTLSAQIAHLPKDWNGTLRIQGHTDTRGSESYNRTLGAKRAEAVKTYLVSLGIPQDRIHTDSFGKDAPLCQEDAPACHDQNRRAEIEWLNSPVAQGEEPMVSMTSSVATGDSSWKLSQTPLLRKPVSPLPLIPPCTTLRFRKRPPPN